jgi:DNA-directed RNA polymerase specialized sigma24 family protein
LSHSNNGRALDALRQLSEEELAHAAAKGDDNAAGVLLERFEEPLHRYTIALIRDPDVAREATWSALFEGARAVRVGEYEEPVKPWLFKIAHAAAGVAGARQSAEAGGTGEAAGAAGGVAVGLLAALDSVPDREKSSLLLRELVGLEYSGIATVTGARPSAARQAVFRARLALQGDVEPTSPYCDEIRAAMSKAEAGVRERRSIASHLETCPVCTDFAEQLERRPQELRELFPPPAEPLVAELLPPLPPRTSAPVATAPEPAPRRAGRRLAPLPLALLLLLVGAGVAVALILSSGGGGGKSSSTAALRAGSTGIAAKPRHPTPAKKHPTAAKKHAAVPAKRHAPASAKRHHRAKRRGGAPATGAGAAAAGATASSSGATANRAAPCKGDPAPSSAQSGYSSRGGALQAEVDPCAHASSGGLANTGLDVMLVVAAGGFLLALGIGVRRLGTSV